MVTIFGKKFKTSKTLIAPNNKVVLAYLKSAKDGKNKVKKLFKDKNLLS